MKTRIEADHRSQTCTPGPRLLPVSSNFCSASEAADWTREGPLLIPWLRVLTPRPGVREPGLARSTGRTRLSAAALPQCPTRFLTRGSAATGL